MNWYMLCNYIIDYYIMIFISTTDILEVWFKKILSLFKRYVSMGIYIF